MKHLDLAALRSLVAISDTQGVTSAAAQINLTQSAVSMQIKRLEHLTGVKLLRRKGRGIVITDAGEQLVSYARRLLAINDEAWGRLTNDEFEGELSIGVPPDLLNPQVPFVLREARRRYPRIKVNLVTALTKSLRAQFEDGKLDLFLATEERARRGGELLLRANLCWWGARNGNAWNLTPLPIAICNNCALKPELMRSLTKSGVAWQFVGDTDTEATIQALVSADLAVTTTIESQHLPNCERVGEGVLPQLRPTMVNLYVESNRNPSLSQKLAEIVRDAFRRKPGTGPYATSLRDEWPSVVEEKLL